MNIIVCDDDYNFSKDLICKIDTIVLNNPETCDSDINCYYMYPPKSLMNYAKNNHIDILVLDISMPSINGLEIAENFHDLYPKTIIIFVSNYENYVFYSIRFNPYRFIRKNRIDFELEEAISSAIKKLLYSYKSISIVSNSSCHKINIKRIKYIEKEKSANYLIIYSLNEKFRYRGNIKEIYSKLEEYDFVKINSGTIVNMRYIKGISGDLIVLVSNEKLSMAKLSTNLIKAKYIKFLREKDVDNYDISF